MILKDIFETVKISERFNKRIDISTDDGMWEFIDKFTCGQDPKWEIGRGDSYKRVLLPEIVSEERIYIYGAGSAGGRTFKLLYDKGIDVTGFIDSSIYKQGTMYFGKRVWRIDEIASDSCIIISNQWYKDIYEMIRNKICIEMYRVYVDYANSLFFSECPLSHIPIHDMAESRSQE